MSTRRRVSIPKGRDPFVNSRLTSLGPGPDGEERFWISTWNSNAGCLAALVTESGQCRLYRFPGHGGFYSVAQEDEDTLWLCGDLSRVLRLSLESGRFTIHPTGAPSALVFQGMVFDPATRKLFAVAFPPPNPAAFSFDIDARKTVKVHKLPYPEKYMRFSFPNGDGTYSCVLHIPGEALLRWDPRSEALESTPLNPALESEKMAGGTTYRLVDDERGRRYFPNLGWYDPLARHFESSDPRPAREMTWFARRGSLVWGTATEGEKAPVAVWDLASGAVRSLCTIPDANLLASNLTRSNKVVAVNLYGDFYRFDGTTGALELSRRLPTDSIGAVDCLQRIDRNRLIGTPFITQRFWEVNLRTGKGEDCGRAAPGAGEILKTWKLGSRVYMAAYGGGELMEYDPGRPARFPENPRVVADPPEGMRPVAAANDGRCLFYSCSHPYGKLGSVLTRYDTRTGQTLYRDNPLPDQQVVSLRYDRKHRCLLAASSPNADCGSAPATCSHGTFARLSPDTLDVLESVPAPKEAGWPSIVGPMGAGRYLTMAGIWSQGASWFIWDASGVRIPPVDEMPKLPPEARRLAYAGRPGFFVVHVACRLELWDMRKPSLVRVLEKNFKGYRFETDNDSLYEIYPKHLVVIDGIA